MIRRKLEEPADETLQVILDARNGIGLSEAFDNIDDLMEALNAEDQVHDTDEEGSEACQATA